MLQAIKDEPTDNIILSGEKVKLYPERLEKIQGAHSHFYPTKYWTFYLGMKQEKENKSHPN